MCIDDYVFKCPTRVLFGRETTRKLWLEYIYYMHFFFWLVRHSATVLSLLKDKTTEDDENNSSGLPADGEGEGIWESINTDLDEAFTVDISTRRRMSTAALSMAADPSAPKGIVSNSSLN